MSKPRSMKKRSSRKRKRVSQPVARELARRWASETQSSRSGDMPPPPREAARYLLGLAEKQAQKSMSKRKASKKFRTRIRKQARSKRTKSWHLYYARKFKASNNIGNKFQPYIDDSVPPNEFITNENMEVFLAACWACGNKPNVLQGKKYLNHILTSHGRPTVNRKHRQDYASVIDFLNGLRDEPRWKAYGSKSADSLTQEQVKKILCSTIFNLDGSLNKLKLRNKCIAVLLFAMGFHPDDVHRLKDSNVFDLPHHVDRDLKRRPKLLLRDLIKTKQHHMRVKNTVGCGCRGDHDPCDERCFYTIFTAYMMHKDDADERLKQRLSRFNKAKRKVHIDDDGHFTNKSFFRSIEKDDCSQHGLHKHRNIGKAEVRGVFEYFNQKLNLTKTDEHGKRPNLTTDQGRRTFCTLAERFFGFASDDIMAVSHHDDPNAYFSRRAYSLH